MSPGRGGAAVASEGRGDEGSVVREETFVVIGAVVSTLVCAGDIELRVIDRGVWGPDIAGTESHPCGETEQVQGGVPSPDR
jgi:hypothetical protein